MPSTTVSVARREVTLVTDESARNGMDASTEMTRAALALVWASDWLLGDAALQAPPSF